MTDTAEKRPTGTKKQETRKRMIAAADRSFRCSGYAGIGVDGIAKAAGVTSGAFYAHLGSKDAAFELAVGAGLDEVIENLPKFQQENGAAWMKVFADYYLGQDHRDNLECGCAMTSLTPEVARMKGPLNALYTSKMQTIVGLMVKGLAGCDQAEKEARSWAVLSTLIGGLNVSRAVGNEAVADQIAISTKSAALAAAGETSAG